MSQSRQPALPDPEDLGPPDVGFVSAVGVYVALLAVALAITVGFAVDGTAATVVGVVSSAATGGLVVGSLLASRADGLPERLGRRPRSLVLPFVAPIAFTLATVLVTLVPAIPAAVGLGTGFGAVGTFLAALGIVAMARSRYARAMTPDEPAVTVSRLRPTQGRRSIGIGSACLLGGIALRFVASPAGGEGDELAVTSWPFAAVGVLAVVVGVAFVFVGVSYRVQFGDRGENSRVRSLLPDRTRRTVFGTDWSLSTEFDRSYLPTMRVHDRGLVAEGPLGDRFVPWGDVTAVRLTDSTLIVEHRGRFDLRCARSMIDDPETVAAELERRRTDAALESRESGRESAQAGHP